MHKKCQPNAKMCKVNRVSLNYRIGSPTGISMMLTSLFWTFTHHVTVSTAAPICCGTFCGLTNSAWITGCSTSPWHWHFRSKWMFCFIWNDSPQTSSNHNEFNFSWVLQFPSMKFRWNSDGFKLNHGFQFLGSQSVGRATLPRDPVDLSRLPGPQGDVLGNISKWSDRTQVHQQEQSLTISQNKTVLVEVG